MKKNIIIATLVACCIMPGGCSGQGTEPVGNEAAQDYVEDKVMTLDFNYGKRTGKYTGHIVDGLPDGVGKFISENDSGESLTYVGKWDAHGYI